MDLRLTAEQQHLVQTFASLYGRESTPERVRAAEPGGFDKALWERLVEIGVVPMAVDPEWGASLIDLALIAEQQGCFLASAPVIEAQVAARLLSSAGHIPGDGLTTLAVRHPNGTVAELVPAGAIADAVAVLVDDRLVLVALDDTNRTPVENLGSAPLADVDVGDQAVVIGSGLEAAWETAIDEWEVLTANALVGIAAGALELVVDYAKDRHAWEVPIGSFQGVAHRLADVATQVDGARLLAREAAWAADAAPERFSELAAMAFGFASEAARDATYWAVHFHGGYGFMLEHDVQLYYRRARAWPRVLGAPAWAYQRAAARRYGPA